MDLSVFATVTPVHGNRHRGKTVKISWGNDIRTYLAKGGGLDVSRGPDHMAFKIAETTTNGGKREKDCIKGARALIRKRAGRRKGRKGNNNLIKTGER